MGTETPIQNELLPISETIRHKKLHDGSKDAEWPNNEHNLITFYLTFFWNNLRILLNVLTLQPKVRGGYSYY